MAIILKHIELHNIRHHQHMKFVPAESGVTAISGPNGTGKSTIVDSIAWALYGTKPSGVSKASALIRDGVDVGKSEVKATVVLQVDNSLLEVTRRIVSKAGAVQVNVREMQDGSTDWVHRAGPAVTSADPYIRKRLKMDEQGFLAALLVQQKQVDQLITSSPKDRARVIEKLTGIAAITAGMGEARQQHNEAKRRLQHSDFDKNLLPQLKKEFAGMEGDTAKKQEQLASVTTKLDEATKAADELSAQVADQEKLHEETEELNKAILQAEAGEEASQGELERLNEQKESKRAALKKASAGDAKELEAKLNSMKTDLRNLSRTSATYEQDVTRLTEACHKAESVQEKVKVDLDTLNTNETKFEALIVDLEEQLRNAEANSVSSRSEVAKITKAKKVIESGEGVCPTCLQSVHDKEAAIARLDDELVTVNKQTEESQKAAAELSGRLSAGRKKLDDVRTAVRILSGLQSDRDALSVAKENVKQIDGQIVALEKEVQAVEKTYLIARRAADLQDEYNQLLKAVVSHSDRIEKMRKSKTDAQDKLKSIGKVSTRTLTSLRKKLTEATESRNEMWEKRSNLREEIGVAGARIESLELQIARAESDAKNYQTLLNSVEVAGHTVELIEEFRNDRIHNALPLVARYASDLLARFTDGAFMELRLDQKFNATVMLSNGSVRPVALLSGGELSAAALALRLAVNMLLTGGSNKSMLVLDEVLVSQDVSRAEQILGALKEVFRGQIIIISHGPHTNEISDMVVEL